MLASNNIEKINNVLFRDFFCLTVGVVTWIYYLGINKTSLENKYYHISLKAYFVHNTKQNAIGEGIKLIWIGWYIINIFYTTCLIQKIELVR